MVIFVEGVDGSGKTTLCNKLKNHGYNVVRTEITDGKEKINDITASCINSNETYIFDRGPLTALVYRLADRKKDTIYGLENCAHYLSNCKIIYCKNKTSFEDSLERGEDNITSIDKHKDIVDNYSTMLSIIKSFTNTKIFEYDWHEDNIYDVKKFIKEA